MHRKQQFDIILNIGGLDARRKGGAMELKEKMAERLKQYQLLIAFAAIQKQAGKQK